MTVTGAGALPLPLPTKQPPRLNEVITNAIASANFLISAPHMLKGCAYAKRPEKMGAYG